MLQLSPVVFAIALGLAGRSVAQQFPPPVTYDTVLQSPINPNITISYRTPDADTCTTAFATQKQYSGYVNLPPFTLEPYQQNYSINTFFWFFEARKNPETAPLTIWLNGGPGASSMIGLFREAGPCEVVQLEDGSYGTQKSTWGWDRSSNLLFIDQPTQVGFSYDEARNSSQDLRTSAIYDEPMPLPQGNPAWSFLNGTFSSNDEDHTQNSTVIAARAAWHFLQGFLSAFPQYNPGQKPNRTTIEPAGVNLFAESYGGQYGPTFADFFEDQNERRRTGEIPANSTLEIKLASLGIINGLVDALIQTPQVANFTYSNTYGVQGIDQTSWLNYLSDFKSPGGCQDLVGQCQSRMKANDPEGESFDDDTTSICVKANDACYNLIVEPIYQAGRSAYDIRVTPPSSFPNYAYLEYLSNADVLRSIGARVNYTETSYAVTDVFDRTGDLVRGTQLQKFADLLARGVRVAFIYGDADIICNWYGGEAVSLAVARLSAYNTTFPAAGYADIVSNGSYVGGQVRQYGNLSFSRIYDAGHTVPSYQDETAFTVFTRIIQGDDVGMGGDVDLTKFGTQGPANSNHANKVPQQPKSTCWIRAINDTCDAEERKGIAEGSGFVKYGMWLANNNPNSQPATSLLSHVPTTTARIGSSTTEALTGVYTATATPSPTSGASRLLFRVQPRRARREVLQKVLQNDGDEEDEDKKKKNRIIKGLAGGLAGLGGLLLLVGGPALLYHLLRRRKNNRRAETPSPLPTSEPSTPKLETPPTTTPQKKNIVQRIVMRRPDSDKTPTPRTAPADIERPADPLPVDERRASPRPSAPMEPIPETPLEEHHPSQPAPVAPVQKSAVPDSDPPEYRRLSEPKPIALVQRSATLPPTIPEERRPSEPAPLQRSATQPPSEPVPVQRSTTLPPAAPRDRRASEAQPVQKSATLPPTAPEERRPSEPQPVQRSAPEDRQPSEPAPVQKSATLPPPAPEDRRPSEAQPNPPVGRTETAPKRPEERRPSKGFHFH